jgi:hypothetical protein
MIDPIEMFLMKIINVEKNGTLTQLKILLLKKK